MRLIKYVLIAFLAIQVVGCKPSDKKAVAATESVSAKLQTSSVDIKGMTCEIGCAKTIESKISKLEGVTASKVNFETKKGEFTYDSNKVSEEEIVSTINGLLDGKTYTATKSTCKPECVKVCCDKEKTHCKPGCEKPCCKAGAKECKPGCEKACCDKAKAHCKPGCEKPCCKTEAKECKPGCEKPCCVA